MVEFENIPAELQDRRQWVLWKVVTRTDRNGKPAKTKVPFQCNGVEAESDNPATWNTFNAVRTIYSRNPTAWAGIGYMFAADDPFCGVDLDMCLSANHEFVTDWAEQALEWLDGAYVEFSPSDRGLKAFARGKFPIPPKSDGKKASGRTFKDLASAGTPDEKKAELAVWNERRFFAVTGRVFQERAAMGECQSGIDRVFYSYWPPEDEKPSKATSSHGSVGVRPDAVDLIKRSTSKMDDGEDGSKRLYTAACRCVELNCSDAEAVASIRAAAASKPFPRDWSDGEILSRVRDAEGKVERGSEVLIANFQEIEVEGDEEMETIKVPLSPSIISAQARLATGDWPRRNGGAMFVDDPHHGLGWFEKSPTASLFGYFRDKAKVKWISGGGSFVSQSEFAAEYQRTATGYDSIELTPHEPKRSATYYRCDFPAPGDGRYLRQFLDLFRPETAIDRDLIQAAAMSLIWGGPFGATPAFALTSDQGRGVGKTTCVQLLARIVGGSIDVSHNEDGDKLTTRLLTPAARTKRVVAMDNVKASKLSSEKIEGLITATEISGRQLYVGEGTRPNNLIWFLTLNGPSMATDLAQRTVPIKLVRCDNSGPWLENAMRFVDTHRQQLIGDLIGALRADPFQLEKFTRWATWEQAVLSRLPEPADAQRVIAERQAKINTDLDEGEIVEAYFANQLEMLDYDADEDQIRIPSATAALWFAKAIGEPMKTAPACRRIHQMHNEGQLPRVYPEPSRKHGRNFVWRGANADLFEGRVLDDFQTKYANNLSRHFYSN